MTKVNSDLSSRHPIRLKLPRTGQARSAEQSPHDLQSSATVASSPDLMSAELTVQRIMRTGTVWFAAAVGSVALTMGLLLSSGWRPAVLVGSVRLLWWAGSAIVALSIGLIGWSGCPILEVDVPTASRNKSRTMQLGTMLFIVGSTFAIFAVLLGPTG